MRFSGHQALNLGDGRLETERCAARDDIVEGCALLRAPFASSPTTHIAPLGAGSRNVARDPHPGPPTTARALGRNHVGLLMLSSPSLAPRSAFTACSNAAQRTRAAIARGAAASGRIRRAGRPCSAPAQRRRGSKRGARRAGLRGDDVFTGVRAGRAGGALAPALAAPACAKRATARRPRRSARCPSMRVPACERGGDVNVGAGTGRTEE